MPGMSGGGSSSPGGASPSSSPSASSSGSTPGSAGAGGLPDTTGGDAAGVFDKSLGDFDGDIARERDGMASSGKGSSKGAQSREAGDASAVKQASERASGQNAGKSGGQSGGGGGQAGAAGGKSGGQSGGASGGMEGAGPDAQQAPGDQTENGGAQAKTPSGPKDATATKGKGVAAIPDDIPVDGTGENVVAKQIREAAVAEQDPAVREALWNEYRRVMGIKK
jgi:hypothetical protein